MKEIFKTFIKSQDLKKVSREKKNQVMESKTFTLFVQVNFHGGMLRAVIDYFIVISKCRPKENSNEEKGKNFFFKSGGFLMQNTTKTHQKMLCF